jgi:hypothetical protein
VRRGQFDDLDTPALDILDDEDARKPAHASKTSAPEGDGAAPTTDAARDTGKDDAG